MTEHPAPYSSPYLYQAPIKRIFAAAECQTQTELADFLGISQSSISDAKRRNAIPAEWLIKLLRRKSINPEWILTGLGPKYLGPAFGETYTPVAHITEKEPLTKFSAQELVTELVRRAREDM